MILNPNNKNVFNQDTTAVYSTIKDRGPQDLPKGMGDRIDHGICIGGRDNRFTRGRDLMLQSCSNCGTLICITCGKQICPINMKDLQDSSPDTKDSSSPGSHHQDPKNKGD